MQASMSATRILIVLLVLRMLAAPVALSDSVRVQAHQRVVVRVCAWPAHRPQRLTSVQTLIVRFHCGWDDAAPRVVPVPVSVTHRFADVSPTLPSAHVHVQLSDCARC
jgi:hypothetical protein